MVVKNVQVVFTKQSSVYYPGEIVDGKLYIFINSVKDVKVSELYIKFNGVAKVSWGASDSIGDSIDTITYSSSEIYFSSRFDVIKATDLACLIPGEHSFKFSFHLPQNIPSTFKGRYGDIIYILKIKAKIPWKLSYKYEIPINVDSKLIIADYPKLKLPHNLSVEKSYSSCFRYGLTSINVMLAKTIYFGGEIINIAVNVENNSNTIIKDLVFKLRKIVEFISDFPRIEKNKDASTVKKIHVGMLSAKLSEKMNYEMQIPNNVDTFNLETCSIINFNYILYVKAIFSGPSRPLTKSIPLVITSKQ